MLNGISDQGKRAAPAPLNGNLPLVDDFPDQAANLAPILKDALTKSGVFYESHQARWVAGELPTAALKLEPQRKFSIRLPTVTGNAALPATNASASEAVTIANGASPDDPAINTLNATIKQEEPGKQNVTGTSTAAVDSNLAAKSTDAGKAVNVASNTQGTTQSSQPAAPANAIPRDLVPIVQQQLDALSTQNYAWQGQIWPGQQMQWEIGEDPDGNRATDNDAIARWQTRLKLSLPMLGGINAVLRLNPAGEVSVTVTADSTSSETRLRESASLLGGQMESAGLKLTQLLVEHGETAE